MLCCWAGYNYFTIDGKYKRFVAAEYQRSCNYQEIIIANERNINELKQQSELDRSDYNRLADALTRERQYNREHEEQQRQIEETSRRAEEREREAVKRIEEAIDRIKDCECN